MKKHFITIIALFCIVLTQAQRKEDLFTNSGVPVTWLGVDYSHVKLIGEFSQFADAGQQGSHEIRNKYFPAWNHLILKERAKYDVQGMLRKDNMIYDIGMINDLNATTPLEDLEANNPPSYSRTEIEAFVKRYDIKSPKGIGIVFIAESMNDYTKEAYYHFVAFNMQTKEILLQEKIMGRPRGFGLRNYWAGSIFEVIDQIKSTYYKTWKRQK